MEKVEFKWETYVENKDICKLNYTYIAKDRIYFSQVDFFNKKFLEYYKCSTKIRRLFRYWDSATNNRSAKLHPQIRCAVKNFINKLESEMGIKLRVIQGLRTYAEQNALYAQGRTTKGNVVTKAKGGQSNHNFGLAIGVAEIKNRKIDWKEQEKVLPKIAPIGKKWGFSWGGDWKSIIDKPHFEMTFGKSLSELRKAYEENGKDHTKIRL